MKRTALYLLVGLVLACVSTSCNKDEQTQGFRATTEGCGDKTSLAADGLTINWSAGDQILIQGSGNTAGGYLYQVSSGAGTTNAEFTYAGPGSDPMLHEPYTAFYPASALIEPERNVTPPSPGCVIPTRQTYVEGGMVGFPMVAISNDRNLYFKNVCGVLKIHATKANTNISRIAISTDDAISGTTRFGLSDYSDYPIIYANDYVGSSYTTTLMCPTPQSIDNGRDFYIYVRGGYFRYFEIKLYTDDNRVCTKVANTGISVNRSQITTINLPATSLTFEDIPSYTRPDGAIGHPFRINQAGREVYFSQGNLQYINGTWGFAAHQYDYLDSYSEMAWDLFGWSTTTNNFGMSTSDNEADYTGTFVDWGTAVGDGHTWYSLSPSEWDYILSHNVCGYATITIDGQSIHGVVILPNDWEGASINTNYSSWNDNTYTATTWAAMEIDGAIFFPAAGFRVGTYIYRDSYYYYIWTNQPTFAANFPSCCAISEDPYRGCSVRLVCDAQ
ncbi:MAG: hypothetical protein MJZ45_03920 [Bacteroidales bacterium]|nr:hypothetical protein [Bacteroidales bacterium]